MTNEQYSNMMVALAKLEAKIDSLEQEIKLLELNIDYNMEKPVSAESFSRFLELNTNTGS